MITIQKKSLTTPDDTGADVAPGVGDSIDLGGVTAVVKADNGDTLDIDIESVNGTPVVGDAADTSEPTTEETLMAAAEKADKSAE